jgi:hypothetical protein
MIEPSSENDHQNIILIENESQKNTLDNKLEELKKLEDNNNNKNISINKNNNEKAIRMDFYGQEISKIKKKHKVSFIDQVQSKKDFAQIIYINDQASLKDDKIDINKCLDILRKRSTNVSEYFGRENQERNEAETYKIKRPNNSRFKKRKAKMKDKIDQHCNCIIF